MDRKYGGKTWRALQWVSEGGGAHKSTLKFSIGKLKKRDQLKGIGVHERIILKWIVNMVGRRGVGCNGFIEGGRGLGVCEDDAGRPVSVTRGNLLSCRGTGSVWRRNVPRSEVRLFGFSLHSFFF